MGGCSYASETDFFRGGYGVEMLKEAAHGLILEVSRVRAALEMDNTPHKDKARFGTVKTVHVVTRDIANPYHEHRDKRESLAWPSRATIPSGTRLMVLRDYGDNEPNRMGEGCSVHIYLESRPHSEGLNYWEHRTLGEDTVKVIIYGDRRDDLADESKASRERIIARRSLIRELLASLSEPLQDFDAVCTVHGVQTSEVLHRLYLQGAVSLNQITAMQVEIDEEYAVNDAAKKAEIADKYKGVPNHVNL